MIKTQKSLLSWSLCSFFYKFPSQQRHFNFQCITSYLSNTPSYQIRKKSGAMKQASQLTPPFKGQSTSQEVGIFKRKKFARNHTTNRDQEKKIRKKIQNKNAIGLTIERKKNFSLFFSLKFSPQTGATGGYIAAILFICNL